MWHYGMNWNTSPLMWAGMILGLIILLILIGLIIWALIKVSQQGNTSNNSYSESKAEHLLKERYARGEIGTEEYRERLAELEGKK